MVILDILFPMYPNYRYNKKLKAKIDNFELSTSEIAGFSEIPLDIVKDKYQDSLNIKSKFEDKAKANIVALTIAISIMFGLSGLVSNIYAKLPSPTIQVAFFIIVIAAFLYMLIAGMMSISVIVNNNEIYALDYSDLIREEQVVKESYQEALELNTIKNLIRNNNIFSSYECIRNSIICLLIIFILAVFPIEEIGNTETKYEYSHLYGYTVVYNIDTELPENLDFDEIQTAISTAITGKIIKTNSSMIIMDKERKFEFEIFCKDKTITVLSVTKNSD